MHNIKYKIQPALNVEFRGIQIEEQKTISGLGLYDSIEVDFDFSDRIDLNAIL